MDLATNTNITNIGVSTGAKTIFESIAYDGTGFYGWDQGNSNNSALYRYGSPADFASDTGGVVVGSSGSHIWDAQSPPLPPSFPETANTSGLMSTTAAVRPSRDGRRSLRRTTETVGL